MVLHLLFYLDSESIINITTFPLSLNHMEMCLHFSGLICLLSLFYSHWVERLRWIKPVMSMYMQIDIHIHIHTQNLVQINTLIYISRYVFTWEAKPHNKYRGRDVIFFHYPNAYNSWRAAGVEPGSQEVYPGLRVGQAPNTWAILYILTGGSC